MKVGKNTIKTLMLGLFGLSSLAVFGQTGLQLKAEQALEDKQYIKAWKLAEKACESEESSKDPLSYALKSEALYYISRDSELKDRYPTALKDAVKSIIKGFKKADKEGTTETFKTDNEDLLVMLKNANNSDASTYMRLGKYSKALSLYKISYDLAQDTFSYYMIGKVYEKMDDGTALDYYKAVADWNAAAYQQEKLKNTYQEDPFIYLGKYFVVQDSFEKARYYTYMGLDMFPESYALQRQKYELVKRDMDGLPPSGEYLKMVQDELKNFPADSFMLRKENATYLYLINSLIASDAPSKDSMINAFAKRKQNYFSHKKSRSIKQNDPFVREMKQEVRMLLVDYYNNFGFTKSSNYVFDYWMKRTYKAKENEAAFLKEIADLESKSRVGLIHQLYQHTHEKYSSSKALQQMADYFNSMELSNIAYDQQLDFISLNEDVAKNFPVRENTNKLRFNKLRYLKNTADQNDFYQTYFMFDDYVKNYGSSKFSDSILRELSMQDFDQNYFGSAIVKMKKFGATSVPDIRWQDGSITACREGYLPDSIQQKVLDRINYFRRNAGLVKEMVLVKQLNTMCQQAAAMFEANRLLNHEPPNTWKCWTLGASTAAKNSIITQKTNSVLAVSSFMKDNKDFVGNRRWLLNPYAAGMGHGSTYTYSAIWVMDMKNIADSVYYENHFTAWPGTRGTPKMLVFDKWSFSMHQNMEGATVSMTDEKGGYVQLKQFPVVNGYGLPTLVWQPTVDLTAKGDKVYNVKVSLANGKSYEYKVNLIDYKPALK